MRHIVPISGKDSLWTAICMHRTRPDLELEYMFNDTGLELPETYAWLDSVEKYLQRPIKRIGESLEDLMYERGFLPSRLARYCTRETKIYPMEDYLKQGESTVYYGIRYDERERIGYRQTRPNITPAYPLIELEQTIKHVYDGLFELNMLPPAFYWERLERETQKYTKVDTKSIHELLRRQLFAWRTRTNCFMCFNQRRYEWVGLMDNHPELFERAVQYEEEIGAKGYTFIMGIPLKDLHIKAEGIVERRAKKLGKYLDTLDLENLNEDELDILSVTSCGLFCGK